MNRSPHDTPLSTAPAAMDEFWNQSKHDIRTNIYYMFLVNSVVPTAANSANPKPVSRSIAKRSSLFQAHAVVNSL